MQQVVWQSHSVNDIGYVATRALDATGTVLHGVTTRGDGFNLSFRPEPDPHREGQNCEVVCAAFGPWLNDLIGPEQVHANGVAVVGRAEAWVRSSA